MRTIRLILLMSLFFFAATQSIAARTIVVYSHQVLLFKVSVGGKVINKDFSPLVFCDTDKKGMSRLKVKLPNGVTLKAKIDCRKNNVYQVKCYRNRYSLSKI